MYSKVCVGIQEFEAQFNLSETALSFFLPNNKLA